MGRWGGLVGIELRTSHVPGKYAISHLYPQNSFQFFILKQSLTKFPRIALISLCNPGRPWIYDPLNSVSGVPGITGLCHQALLSQTSQRVWILPLKKTWWSLTKKDWWGLARFLSGYRHLHVGPGIWVWSLRPRRWQGRADSYHLPSGLYTVPFHTNAYTQNYK